MQQSLLLPSSSSQYFKIKTFQTSDNTKVIDQTYDFSRLYNAHQQTCLPQGQHQNMMSQKRKVEIQTKQDKQIYIRLVNINAVQCSNCAKWKNWAFLQQQMLLQIQKKMILKEQKIRQVMSSFEKEIVQKNSNTENLKLTIQQKIGQIINLEQVLALTNQKVKELESRSRIQETLKKQNKIEILTEQYIQQNKIQAIFLKGIQYADKMHNLTKDSAFTTKTEDSHRSQMMKKKNVQKELNFDKKSQLQKYVFQNQTLKDYNAVLLQRLKVSKYKGFMS